MREKMRVEVLREEGWVEVEMKELVKGDIFKMFNPDGTPARSVPFPKLDNADLAVTSVGTDQFVALGDATMTREPETDEEVWGVSCQAVSAEGIKV